MKEKDPALCKDHPDFPKSTVTWMLSVAIMLCNWSCHIIGSWHTQEKRLYKVWESGREIDLEIEELSWSYEREGEAGDFKDDEDPGDKPRPENAKQSLRRQAGQVKAKTTEQLAKTVSRLTLTVL